MVNSYPAGGYLISIAYCLFFHCSCLRNSCQEKHKKSSKHKKKQKKKEKKKRDRREKSSSDSDNTSGKDTDSDDSGAAEVPSDTDLLKK